MCLARGWDVEAETSGKKSPCHLWEGEKQERSSSEGINRPESGPSEHEVDQTKAEGGNQRLGFTSTGLLEDGRAVESNDVD